MAVTAPFRVQPHTLVSHVYDHPEVIVRWADWLYSMQGNRNANVGVEGQDWRRAKPGEVNYNGNPAMFFVEADALELGQVEPALKDAVDSAIARFVTGNLSIDDDWDGYVRELEGLGRARYLALYQQALDAKRAATQ